MAKATHSNIDVLLFAVFQSNYFINYSKITIESTPKAWKITCVIYGELQSAEETDIWIVPRLYFLVVIQVRGGMVT